MTIIVSFSTETELFTPQNTCYNCLYFWRMFAMVYTYEWANLQFWNLLKHIWCDKEILWSQQKIICCWNLVSWLKFSMSTNHLMGSWPFIPSISSQSSSRINLSPFALCVPKQWLHRLDSTRPDSNHIKTMPAQTSLSYWLHQNIFMDCSFHDHLYMSSIIVFIQFLIQIISMVLTKFNKTWNYFA